MQVTLYIAQKKVTKQAIAVAAIIGICSALLIWRNAGAYRFAKKMYTWLTAHPYFLIFAEGWFIAFFDIEGRVKVSNWKWPVHLLIIVLCIAVRIMAATHASYCLIDILIIAPFVIAVSNMVKRAPKFESLLCFFGRYSTYMWLTHSFICYYYWQKTVTIIPVSSVMFVVLLVLSFALAFVLNKFENRLCVGCAKVFNCEKGKAL